MAVGDGYPVSRMASCYKSRDLWLDMLDRVLVHSWKWRHRARIHGWSVRQHSALALSDAVTALGHRDPLHRWVWVGARAGRCIYSSTRILNWESAYYSGVICQLAKNRDYTHHSRS
jgi:hypothetical protein